MASVTVILSWCLMTVCLKNVLSVRFRTVGLQTPNQTWHEWKRDEQHRQQQRRPGHYRGMSM
ncbi:hypothetical protein EFV16_22260 [Escherichia coli]|nr:hypothetical protein EFV16_22260 [Escherichia coli]